MNPSLSIAYGPNVTLSVSIPLGYTHATWFLNGSRLIPNVHLSFGGKVSVEERELFLTIINLNRKISGLYSLGLSRPGSTSVFVTEWNVRLPG